VPGVTAIEPPRTFWDKIVIVHGLRRWHEIRGELRQEGQLGELSFRDQTKEYLRWAGSRDRKRIKDLVTVEGALNKWILPVIGDLPLAKVNNITVKPLVDKMKKANLAAETVNNMSSTSSR
jgi:hypothetical protein